MHGLSFAHRGFLFGFAAVPGIGWQRHAAIVYTKVDGWSVKETAAALKISEASVKVAVRRCPGGPARRVR
jgi:hypothetical protein